MRAFFVLVLVFAWLSPLSGEDLTVPGEGPKWRMASAGRVWSYELQARGGQAPFTWQVVEGALPPGIHLVDLATVQWGSPSRMGLYGVAAEAGQWPVKLAVTDAGGRTAEANWTVTVSPMALEKASPAFETGAEAQWNLTVAGAAGAARFEVAAGGYLPLGLRLSGEGVLHGRAPLPGRYEVPVAVYDAAGRTLRTVVTVAVYGKETALPQLAARVGVEGAEAAIALESLPETALIDIDWGDGCLDPMKDLTLKHAYAEAGSYQIVVVATLRDGLERVEARYEVTANQTVTSN
jgi:hypothetical protein